MKSILLTAALASAVAATPSVAVDTAVAGNGIVYTVEAVGKNGAITGVCTFVADRWTADYGPTTVTAVAAVPGTGAWTSIRCTVSKNGTEYVNAYDGRSGSVARIVNQRNGTIPVAGITLCAYAESQLTIDARPTAWKCQNA